MWTVLSSIVIWLLFFVYVFYLLYLFLCEINSRVNSNVMFVILWGLLLVLWSFIAWCGLIIIINFKKILF